MDRFVREHIDGIGDGLSIAVGILDSARNLSEAKERVKAELINARRAKDLANMDLIRRLMSA